MRGVNKVILVGNLGGDPEVRHTASGTAIATINIATSESWTDKQSGEKQERTEWHRVQLFGRLGEIAGDYLKKGRQVYIEGSLRTDKYTDKAGVERYSTNVIASEMQMLGTIESGNSGSSRGNGASGSGAGGNGARGNGGRSQDRNTRLDQRQNGGNDYGARGSHQSGGSSFDDDDIPF